MAPEFPVTRELQIVMVSTGPNRAKVIVRVKELLGLTLREARKSVDRGDVVLATGFTKRLYDLRDEFQSLGASVRTT